MLLDGGNLYRTGSKGNAGGNGSKNKVGGIRHATHSRAVGGYGTHGRLHDSLGNLHLHLLLGIFGLDLGNLLLFLLFELLALGRIVAGLLYHLVILFLRNRNLVVRLRRVV